MGHEPTQHRTLLTIGAFDCPHAGHAAFLRRCEAFADRVIVGLRSDELVEKHKGAPAVFSFEERAQVLDQLGYEVRKSSGPGRDLIEATGPRLLAVGSDWSQDDFYARHEITADFIDDREITVLFIPRSHGISTSEIRRRLSG